MYLNEREQKIKKELEDLVHHLEVRLEELEKNIKATTNQGVKALMQNTYVLNKSMLQKYKFQLAKLSL